LPREIAQALQQSRYFNKRYFCTFLWGPWDKITTLLFNVSEEAVLPDKSKKLPLPGDLKKLYEREGTILGNDFGR
jgi:hypothetical protein